MKLYKNFLSLVNFSLIGLPFYILAICTKNVQLNSIVICLILILALIHSYTGLLSILLDYVHNYNLQKITVAIAQTLTIFYIGQTVLLFYFL